MIKLGLKKHLHKLTIFTVKNHYVETTTIFRVIFTIYFNYRMTPRLNSVDITMAFAANENLEDSI